MTAHYPAFLHHYYYYYYSYSLLSFKDGRSRMSNQRKHFISRPKWGGVSIRHIADFLGIRWWGIKKGGFKYVRTPNDRGILFRYGQKRCLRICIYITPTISGSILGIDMQCMRFCADMVYTDMVWWCGRWHPTVRVTVG